MAIGVTARTAFLAADATADYQGTERISPMHY